MIRLQNVYKTYGGRPALVNINLHIALGEFAFLVGPSGAGKSTLMRLLYREEKPTSGNVFIGGVNLNRLHAGQIPVATTSETGDMIATSSGRKNNE